VAVQITDESGAPVPGASVVFRMPASGPSGRFATGGTEERSLTDAEGKAAAWGIEWNHTPGECRIAIVATAGAARAGTTVSAILEGSPPATAEPPVASYEVAPESPRPSPPPVAAEPAPEPPPSKRPGVLLTRTESLEESIPGPRRKWVVVALALGGAIGTGFAYRMLQNAGAVSAPAVTVTTLNPAPRPTIGNPAITITRP
jgi:hypothetical protein